MPVDHVAELNQAAGPSITTPCLLSWWDVLSAGPALQPLQGSCEAPPPLCLLLGTF